MKLKVYKPIDLPNGTENTSPINLQLVKSLDSSTSDELFTIKTANEWIEEAKNQPIPKALFGPLWHEGELSILVADQNKGKSILGIQIADCITKGISNPHLPIDAKSQPVIYGDFEMTLKQFEKRYSADYKDHYLFSADFHRFEINPDFAKTVDLNEELILQLEQLIEKTGSKIIIIDNLTFLNTQSMDTAKEALPLMQRLKALKSKHGLSILVLAHTPKRSLYNPLTANDIAGSKQLANFADSIFGIGESAIDKSFRYIKQLKSRATEIVFDTENVLECRIFKDFNNLKFEFTGIGNETDHLKSQPEKEELKQKVLELKRDNPNASLREIADKVGTNQVNVHRILKRNSSIPE